METIRVKTTELLDTLKENRDRHQQEFEEAMSSWVKKSTKALADAAKRAKDDGHIEVDVLKDLPRPESFVNSYDTAIVKLEWEQRPEIEITDREFRAYVQDDWQWRELFAANTGTYLVNA